MYDMLPIEIASSGMRAERIRMGLIASNLANAHSSRNAEGTGPYERRMVRMRSATVPGFEQMLMQAVNTGKSNEIVVGPEDSSQWLAEMHLRGVEVAGIEKDGAFRLEFDPEHPDANAEGYVKYPEISVVSEMTDMIMASRNYEGNLAVVKNSRDMVMQLLDLLKQ